MKFRRLLFPCLLSVMTGASAAMLEPGLPVWQEGERNGLEAEGWIAGGLLLTDDPIPEETPQEASPPLDVEQPAAGEIAEPETPPDEIPEKFWPAYFEARPETFLVDPQGILSPVDYRDRLGFLTYHASDSSIDLYVYVFKGDQEIPGEVRDEELVERFFSEGRPAAVVYYYMGAPQRSVLRLSPSLTDTVSSAEQRRALESSVMQAFEKLEPAAQIEAFLVQVSIRIYWMERMLGGGATLEAGVPASPPAITRAEKKPSAVMRKLEPLFQSAERFAMPAAVLFGALFAAFGLTAWLRRNARYQFPDFEVEPRLGGVHAAGVGAVISFASASVPPASQRDQVPDYLRRA